MKRGTLEMVIETTDKMKEDSEIIKQDIEKIGTGQERTQLILFFLVCSIIVAIIFIIYFTIKK